MKKNLVAKKAGERKVPSMLLATVLAAGTLSYSVFADTLEPVVEKSSAINQSAAQSQVKIDRLAEQIDSKLQQFKTVNKETDGLQVYNKQMQKQIENQLLEMQRLNDSVDKVSIIERQITPLMLRMIAGLEEFINIDLPFQKQDRLERVEKLKSTMDRADVSVAEKFRQVLEAYQIELDYGRTLKAYQGMHKLNDVDQPVNFLRVGRVAFYYQSPDKKSQGIWNIEANQWQELGAQYSTRIANGIKMAREQMAPDMLNLPMISAK
ncbi:MAG: DUF3450 domain-containing protein [Kangiellaceae bacterium]|nr:DUF3450 domain-containing protein [Kangiellaceae bacterium]MCW8998266.1 DUF3450 domain-containing protein [Kangiellaceae bacterium]MCW9016194.1 DUF3450 domain-containing protein [Kangiellaceae bacterium]